LRGILTRFQTWVLAALCGLLTAPQAAFAAVWGVPYLIEAHGLSRIEAAGTASFLLVGWGIGSPLAGWFSDFIGRRRLPLLIGALTALVSISCIVYLPGLPLVAVQTLLLVNGIGSGSMILCFVTVREHNAPEAGSAAVGFVNTATMAFSAASQPLIGWILDLNWGGEMVSGARVYGVGAFQLGFITLVGCGILAVAAALLVRETYCRRVADELSAGEVQSDPRRFPKSSSVPPSSR
jgi:MFS family permease